MEGVINAYKSWLGDLLLLDKISILHIHENEGIQIYTNRLNNHPQLTVSYSHNIGIFF